MNNIAECWGSTQDYILSTVFFKPASVDPVTGKLVVDSCMSNIEGQVRFERNEFPYQLTEGGQHSVLWLGPTASGALPSEDDINTHITLALRDHCTRAMTTTTRRAMNNSEQDHDHNRTTNHASDDDDQFDFVWYENPKMTVPLVYHVQVFWCHLTAVGNGIDDDSDNNDHEDV